MLQSASCSDTSTRLSSPITKVLKSWHSFECIFTGMYLREIQSARWGTFTFTLFTSKHAFFLQCSFNSWASFMNPEVAGLAKFWVYTNPNKYFNVVSTLFLGWYDVVVSQNVKSTLKQGCVRQRWNLQRWKMSNQRYLFQCWIEQR